MGTIQWKPEVNALTTPQSYRIRFVPHKTTGYKDMAADISLAHPNYNEELVLSLAPLVMEWIQQQLANGNQVTLEDAFNFRISFTGRLNRADDPLPEDEDSIHVRAYPSQPFVREIRHVAQLVRLPMTQKLPLISDVEDTCLYLKDVLFSQGMLRIKGNNLFFNPRENTGECVIEGTRSGLAVQPRLGTITNSELLLAPAIPPQENPWNNEYILYVTTHYTEKGTSRTGLYHRKLRSILSVMAFGQDGAPEVGILTGSADAPNVRVIGGSASNDERLRIQAVVDLHTEELTLRLLDMIEGGKTGAAVEVTGNGEYTVPGFTDSAVSSMMVRVEQYPQLVEMIRQDYSGRLVDILEIEI